MDNIRVVGGLSIKYRRLRPKWQCFFPIPFISDGYKYELTETYSIQTDCVTADRKAVSDVISGKLYITLDEKGLLTIYAGYNWDGASGPTLDTDSFMRGSLVHDALYQLMRGGHLPVNPNKEIADRLLERLCIENGMSRFRAFYVYQGVHLFGIGGTRGKEPMEQEITTKPL